MQLLARSAFGQREFETLPKNTVTKVYSNDGSSRIDPNGPRIVKIRDDLLVAREQIAQAIGYVLDVSIPGSF